MSLLLALLLLTSSLKYIICFDCSLIKLDGNYSQISIYSRLDAKQNIEYWMKNSLGKELRFELTDDGQIIAIDDSARDVNPPDLYTRLIDIRQINGINTGMECDVLGAVFSVDSYWRKISCTSFGGQSANSPLVKEVQSTKNSILFGPYYSFADFIKVKELDRLNRTYKRIIWFEAQFPTLHCQNIGDAVDKDSQEFCDKWFANQLSDDMFASLETAFKFYGKKDTEVLWFNIEGRPKYCIQNSRSELSSQCKDSDSLRTAFEECFPSENSQLKPSESNLGLTIGIIVAILVCVVLLIIIAAVVFLIRRDDQNEKSDSAEETFSKTFKA